MVVLSQMEDWNGTVSVVLVPLQRVRQTWGKSTVAEPKIRQKQIIMSKTSDRHLLTRLGSVARPYALLKKLKMFMILLFKICLYDLQYICVNNSFVILN